MIIYKATSPSGKVYIGKTIYSLNYRKKSHRHLAKSGKKNKFYVAIRKYGFKNFIWEVVYIGKNETELLIKEKEFIIIYNSKENGYNLTDGGEGTSGHATSKGIKRTKEHCLRQSRQKRKLFGKPVVAINIITKEIREFQSRAEAAEVLNINYTMLKTAIRTDYCLYNYRFMNKKSFNSNHIDLYCENRKQPNSKKFYITDGSDIKFINSINDLRRLLNISERAARNVYFKNKSINGWLRIWL